jgi:hypothetical protein
MYTHTHKNKTKKSKISNYYHVSGTQSNVKRRPKQQQQKINARKINLPVIARALHAWKPRRGQGEEYTY